MTYHVVSLRLHPFLVTDCSVDFSQSFLVPAHYLFSAGT